VAFAEDFDICSYTNSTCDDGEECEDGDNGDCVDLDVDDTFNDIGVRAICEDGEPVGSIQAWNSDDCEGVPLLDETAQEDFCFPVRDDIYIKLFCDDDICFSAFSTVKMADGQMKTLDEVRVGDMVESVDSQGRRTFSEVFLIQHGKQTAVRRLRQIHYNTLDAKASGAITLSNTHLLRVAKHKDEFVPAKSIKAGSKIFVVPESESEATAAVVTKILNVRLPVRNIHTMNDRIVVDGVVASSTTDALPFLLSRILLAPLKVLHKMGLGNVVKYIDTYSHKLGRTSTLKKLLH